MRSATLAVYDRFWMSGRRASKATSAGRSNSTRRARRQTERAEGAGVGEQKPQVADVGVAALQLTAEPQRASERDAVDVGHRGRTEPGRAARPVEQSEVADTALRAGVDEHVDRDA